MTTGKRDAIVGALRKKLIEAQLRLDEANILIQPLLSVKDLETECNDIDEYLVEPECVE